MPDPIVKIDSNLELPPSRYRSYDVSIQSKSGSLRGKFSESLTDISADGVILCPGLAVGMEGDFVRDMEQRLLNSGVCKWSLRFNFFGHSSDTLNSDIRGFTFSRAIDDFSAGVKMLRQAGAQRIIAVSSSTGTQPAVLAGCDGVDGEKVDLIVARAAVLDCFASVIGKVPAAILDEWKTAGAFQYPVGGSPVTMGADLLSDIEQWRVRMDLSKLQVPLVLFHGEEDRTVPVEVIRGAVKSIPSELLSLTVIPGVSHDFSGAEQLDHLSAMAHEIAERLSRAGGAEQGSAGDHSDKRC